MRKKFVSKNKHKSKTFKVIKYMFLILIVYVIYKITFGTLLTIKVMSSNEEFLKYLISDSNHHILYNVNSKSIISKAIQFFSNTSVNDPLTILNNSLNLKSKNNASDVYDDTYESLEMLSKVTSHIEDPNPTVVDNPKVYIYNSHQLENYSNKDLETYNVTPNVMMASYLLKEKLNKKGINTIVEDSDITEFMKINNWNHADSYKASRFYILEALNNNPSLELIIDLHRDALTHDNATVNIDGKDYAKVLFVVGMEHDNYKENLELANKINNMIKEKYPTLTRGVITKSGKNVDGIYNQDISPKMILLELGGHENTIEEVMNTANIVSDIIKELLG